MEYIESLITIGAPVGAGVWLLIRTHVKSEINSMVTALHDKINTELNRCSERMVGKLEGKASLRDVEKIFEIVEELRAQIVDVLVDARSRERSDR